MATFGIKITIEYRQKKWKMLDNLGGLEKKVDFRGVEKKLDITGAF